MNALILTYHLESRELRDAFYQALTAHHINTITQQEPGCIKYDYYLPCDCDKDLLLVEIWESEAHQKAHTQQPHFAVTQGLKAKYHVTVTCEAFSR